MYNYCSHLLARLEGGNITQIRPLLHNMIFHKCAYVGLKFLVFFLCVCTPTLMLVCHVGWLEVTKQQVSSTITF